VRLAGGADASRSLSVVGAGVGAFDFPDLGGAVVAGEAGVAGLIAGVAEGSAGDGEFLCINPMRIEARLPDARRSIHLGTKTTQS
jgi:hypothetical protein